MRYIYMWYHDLYEYIMYTLYTCNWEVNICICLHTYLHTFCICFHLKLLSIARSRLVYHICILYTLQINYENAVSKFVSLRFWRYLLYKTFQNFILRPRPKYLDYLYREESISKYLGFFSLCTNYAIRYVQIIKL